ncbi:hypothetical protein GCM10022232_72250 [Streptomyces plumbiresistens]|uniref:Uncharacterized protein n=1 Tax=Streptomyces plumbiresistens TaxID=511811 RepID=A0ABP7SYH3_9ACTN
MYSIFGVAWFSDPRKLFALVRQRLNLGGVFVFSQPPGSLGAYGLQGMYKGGFAGPAMYTYRFSYTHAMWRSLLLSAGLRRSRDLLHEAPKPDHIGTSDCPSRVPE